MKTTLILNPEYKKLRSRQTFWAIFATFNFVTVLLPAKVKGKIESDIGFSGRRDKLPRRVYSLNNEASVSNDGKIQGFVFVSFLFLSSVIKFDKKCANSTQRSQSRNS